MRILMPCAAFPPFADGGGPISSFIIAKMLVAEGHDLLVVNVGDDDTHEVYEGIPVHRIHSQNIYWNYYTPRPAWKKMVWHALENGNPKAYLTMKQEISSFRPDVVITISIENTNVATWAAAHALGVPVVHITFSTFLMCWNATMRKNDHNCVQQCIGCKVTSIGKKFLSRFVDGVIGESEDIIRRHTEEGYFANAVTQRIPAAISKVQTTKPRNFPKTRPFRVGFLGVHTRFKGLETLAQAAQLLPEDLHVEFVIAGTGHGAFAEQVRDQFPAHKTKFAGWVNPEAFLQDVDLLIYPTIGREAFGRASIEAFAHAVPVVSTDIGGVAENIKEGFNGFSFRAGDPISLKDAILKIAASEQLYEDLSKGALASASEYLQPSLGRMYTRFLDRVCAQHQQPETAES
ncbi:MAG: glycosyltransferase [Parasphingorhabdus sp.]|uniref:glycosyltransferase n=1 Tax=Alphaproteobacteria TaxID=28211 RepID=UPI0032632D0E